jgi:glutathione S-transferase
VRLKHLGFVGPGKQGRAPGSQLQNGGLELPPPLGQPEQAGRNGRGCLLPRYNADRAYPGPKLIPEDAVFAARVIQWASAIATSVFPALAGYMQANAFPKGTDGKPDPEVIDGFVPVVQEHIGILDRAVKPTGHLAGESFTVADMYLMPILAYLHTFPESAAALADTVHLLTYFQTHALRRSFLATTPPPLGELRP